MSTKRAREEPDENGNAIFLALNDHLWEMIIHRAGTGGYAHLTRTCRRFGEFWTNPQIQARILERFTVHLENRFMTSCDGDSNPLPPRLYLHAYLVNKKPHRGGGLPAIIEADGSLHWYRYGQCHRDALPAIEYADGSTRWCKNGILHRTGGLPAVECSDGSIAWYENGKPYREGDLPAIIVPGDVQEWYVDGKLGRAGDLPAQVYDNGDCFWWKNGESHRDNDLPAVVWQNGHQREWYKNGKRHRDNGQPAVEYADGGLEWWVENELIKQNF